MRYYDSYVDALSDASGALAFCKWFLIGVLVQLALLIPGVPLVLSSLLLPESARAPAAALLFMALFLATRVLLFAFPCARAAARKRRGPGLAWGIGGFLFGQFALGLVAALSSRADAVEP